MQNGENLQALHKNLEFIRFSSIVVLLIHIYSVCYTAMVAWGLTFSFATQLIFRLSHGLFFLSGITIPKLTALILLVISQIGEQGKKDNKLKLRPILIYIAVGLSLFFLSSFILNFSGKETSLALWYIAITVCGYLFVMFGGARLSRLLYVNLGNDPFNLLAETFPQEERILTNEYSVNLPATYKLKGMVRKSWINIINPFRALLVLGTPGS